MGTRRVVPPPPADAGPGAVTEIPEARMTVYRPGQRHSSAMRAARNRAHRRRHIIGPWLTLGVLAAALLPAEIIHLVKPSYAWILLIPGLITAAVKTRRQAHKTHKVYTFTCVSLASVWLTGAAMSGFTGPGEWLIFFLAIPGIFPLSWLWWQMHAIRTEPEPDPEPEPEPDPEPEPEREPDPDPVLVLWDENFAAQGAPGHGMKLSLIDAIPDGNRYLITLVPGKHTAESAQRMVPFIASALGPAGITASQLTVEAAETPSGEPSPHLGVLTVTNPKPKAREIQEFTGSTLIPEKGIFADGPYPDGQMAYARLYKVDEHGRPMRAASGLYVGDQGSGKSRFMEHKLLEHLLSGLFVTVILDGQGGASMPKFLDHVYWAAITPDEWLRAMQALIRLGMYRANKIARRRDNCWYATEEEPFVQLFIDEAHVVLSNREIVRMLKVYVQELEKCGMGVDLITHKPLTTEMGDSSGAAGASVIRDLLTNGNAAVFQTRSTHHAQIAFPPGFNVDPRALPKLSGMHYLYADCATREASIRAIRAADPEGWAARAPAMTLPPDEEEKADSGTGDLFGRWPRFRKDFATGISQEEIARRLDEILAGRSDRTLKEKSPETSSSPGKPTAMRMVTDIVEKAGHISRKDLLSEVGGAYSDSSVDKALSSMARTGTITNQVEDGYWSSRAYAAKQHTSVRKG